MPAKKEETTETQAAEAPKLSHGTPTVDTSGDQPVWTFVEPEPFGKVLNDRAQEMFGKDFDQLSNVEEEKVYASNPNVGPQNPGANLG